MEEVYIMNVLSKIKTYKWTLVKGVGLLLAGAGYLIQQTVEKKNNEKTIREEVNNYMDKHNMASNQEE